MDSFPVYPYAFIQVAAVARQANIDVICHDLLGEAQQVSAEPLTSVRRSLELLLCRHGLFRTYELHHHQL